MKKIRVDVLLLEKKMVESRSQAQRLVLAGQVLANGQKVLKPAVKIDADSEVTIQMPPQFVSRGGEKLEGAIIDFGMEDLSGKICADVGASTGGFTDCLLQHGAEKVYAIDVGYGILHWKMRNHPRVISMERTNARYVEKLDDPVSLITIDASFISLKILLPVVKNWFDESGGQIITLIKPQFEAGKEEVARGAGVVRDAAIHRKVLMDVLGFTQNQGFGIKNLIQSPLYGPKGNKEFLALLEYPLQQSLVIETLIDKIVPMDDDIDPMLDDSAL
jgi:23S rRNA (cytidine1920-2'-O)/16S rRNA (cytidine1409-2'-O)-methyltransferase